MNPQELKTRTKKFALSVVRLCDAMPSRVSARAIASQLVRSGTSVAANHRAACRARSRAEFISKLGIVVEEADETVFWLELLAEAHLVPVAQQESVLREAKELLAIFAASQITAKRNRWIKRLKSSMTRS